MKELNGTLIALEEDLVGNKFNLEQAGWVRDLVNAYEEGLVELGNMHDALQEYSQKLHDQEQANQHAKHELAVAQANNQALRQVLGVIQFALNSMNK